MVVMPSMTPRFAFAFLFRIPDGGNAQHDTQICQYNPVEALMFCCEECAKIFIGKCLSTKHIGNHHKKIVFSGACIIFVCILLGFHNRDLIVHSVKTSITRISC